jgi:ribosomal protein S18 acetylase RimI-like enzyme
MTRSGTAPYSFSSRVIMGMLALSLSASALWLVVSRTQSDVHIYNFDEQRDTPFMLDLLKENKYWLYEGPEYGFDPEQTLKKRSSSPGSHGKHNLTFKVLYQKDIPVGFVGYHTLSFYIGQILYLVVKPEFRGKKYGYMLLQDAVNDLKKRGVKKIRLVTRTNNASSQNLYKKFGFYQTGVDDGIVTFDYDV